MNWIPKLRTYLSEPIPGHVLGLFRIIFGCFMVYEMIDYIQIDLVLNAFVLPKIQLEYFEFIKPLPTGVLQAMLYTMLACAALIALGVLFRPACFLFGSFYFYFFLLDKGIFNNHLYLFILLAFVLGFTHADRFLSVGNLWRKPVAADLMVPRWEIFIFQLHFAIVYFYGGLAKLNPDWLIHFQPVKRMIEVYPDSGLLAGWLKLGFQPVFFSYAGLAFDLAVPFLLWWKPSRRWVLVPIIYFHISNALTFDDIGIFPFIMMASTAIFFDISELPVLRSLAKAKHKNTELLESPGWAKRILGAYIVFQLLFPFRGLFLPNPVNWTMIANRFAWRMKCQSREITEMVFTIQEGPTGQKMPVDIKTFINTMQVNVVSHDVAAVASVARGLARIGKAQGMVDPLVYASIKVKWNGRPPANTVNPEVELSKLRVNPFEKLDWVMPIPSVK
ncbi:MAG: HTTM domain-containing protein [Saprospiraceae bacterium]|nr:HTTM domain-containing protein [Saprospiraceae bacterium]